MALIDLPTYKTLLGVTATDNDAQVTALLDAASLAVTTYTGRDFEANTGISSPRTYNYDDSNMLDIDDCTAVSTVTVNIPNADDYVMDPNEYTAMPGNGNPVYYYLLLHGGRYLFGISPEMGFARNLDQYPAYRFAPPTITVTATWGWPEVPADVQLATALTIQGIVTTGPQGNEGLSSEAIEGWSRSWGSRGGASASPMLAIPNRARDLLANYQRVYV